MNSKRILTSVASLLLLVLLAACGTKPVASSGTNASGTAPAAIPQGPTKEFRFSFVVPEGSSWDKGARKFADLVKERSGGRLTVKVFPNGQLANGNQTQELQMLQSGAVDFTWDSTIMLTGLDPAFNVVEMPWIFKNEQAVDAFTGSDTGKQLLRRLQDKGVEGLAYGENGFRQLTNNKVAVASPNDVKGLKLRIPGIKMYTDIYKALGAYPTVMNFGEVFVALQQGGLDGHENPLDLIVSAKMYEVQKYITLWDYSYDALVLGMNKKAFDSLLPADQDLIRQAAAEACKYQVQVSREYNAINLKLLQDKGMKVVTMTPEAKAAFALTVQSVYQTWEPTVGADLVAKVKAFSK